MDKIPDAFAPNDPAALAAYIAQISGELARLSRENGLPTLAYILEMARLEARNAALRDSEVAAPRSSVG